MELSNRASVNPFLSKHFSLCLAFGDFRGERIEHEDNRCRKGRFFLLGCLFVRLLATQALETEEALTACLV
jgi:hypothetical protein